MKKSAAGFAASAEASKSDEDLVLGAMKESFRPEFLNRVDEVVFFRALSQKELCHIASLLLSSVTDRIEELGILIEFDDTVTALVAEKGYSPEYGARPLRRTIVRKIEDSFSTEMLEGKFKSGDKVIAVCEDEKIVYKK